MKHLTILCLLIICSNIISAQKSKQFQSNHHSIINKFLQNQNKNNNSSRAAFSQRVLTERVIGQRTIDNMLSSYADSVNVSYILNGTSTYDYNMMLYAYNYPYSTSPMFNFMGVFTKPQILYDTYNHFTVNPNDLVYGFYQQDLNTYDANKNLTNNVTYYADSADYPNMIFDNRFNAANNVDTSYANNFIGGVSSPAFKQFFEYNASDFLIKDSVYEFKSGTWYMVSKTYYLYDGANNLLKIDMYSNTQDTTFTLPLIEQLQYLNTYDGSNRLVATVTNFWDGAALNPYVRDTFNYTGASTFHTDWKEYQYDAINAYWAPQTFMQKNLNGSGLPDSININLFDSLLNMWVPSCKQIITYNADDNPIKLDEYWYNFTSFPSTPDFETTYYYETFTNTTGLTENAETVNNFTLFPNPNNGNMQLNYKIEDNAVLNLHDYTGEKIKTYTLASETNSIILNESRLANGVYFYSVSSTNIILYSNKFIVEK